MPRSRASTRPPLAAERHLSPATAALDAAGVQYQVRTYVHDPAVTDFGDEAAAQLGLPADRILKTLVVRLEGGSVSYAVGVVPVSGRLDLKLLAKAAGAKRAQLADPAEAQRRTGYVVGGISPLGQRQRLPIYIDAAVRGESTIAVSGGRRGVDIELAPDALAQATRGHWAPLGRA